MSDEDIPPIQELPAAYLAGRTLEGGWTITKRLTKPAGMSGGYYSISYEVVGPDGTVAFLKALNYLAVMGGPGLLVDRLKAFTSAYTFERDLLADCGDRKMRRIIRMLGHGQTLVPEAGPLISEVPYIIFELAEGDIRQFQSSLNAFDVAFVLRALKHILEGVEQLHAAGAAHQDLKPSNVLTQYIGKEIKLGDLGNAERVGIKGPVTQRQIPGAVVYAPPEQHYGAFTGTWEERRAADVYLTGSLGTQMFLGNCMSALLQSALEPPFRLNHWTGGYAELIPYLRTAHGQVIRDLQFAVRSHVPDDAIAGQFAHAIAQMTDPDPAQRGHPKDRSAGTSSYAVRRFVSLMDLLLTQLDLLRHRRPGLRDG
jgi:serine/threonine protein kinase